MKPSPGQNSDAKKSAFDLDLEFPDGRTFISEPPHVGGDRLMELSLKALNDGRRFRAEKKNAY